MLSSYNIHCFFIFKCYNENIISEKFGNNFDLFPNFSEIL